MKIRTVIEIIIPKNMARDIEPKVIPATAFPFFCPNCLFVFISFLPFIMLNKINGVIKENHKGQTKFFAKSQY